MSGSKDLQSSNQSFLCIDFIQYGNNVQDLANADTGTETDTYVSDTKRGTYTDAYRYEYTEAHSKYEEALKNFKKVIREKRRS